MSQTNSEVIVDITKSPITISRIYKSEFQKDDTLTCELKQTVTTVSKYPTKSVANSLSDSLFGTDDFGFEKQEFTSERTNVAWILVPLGTTQEEVQRRLDAAPKATLYRIVSNRPILTDQQKYAIKNGITTLDVFANAQIIRHGNDEENGKWKKDDLVLDKNGKPQYKCCFFSLTQKEDENLCTENPEDFYASPEIQAEMNLGATIVVGQTI